MLVVAAKSVPCFCFQAWSGEQTGKCKGVQHPESRGWRFIMRWPWHAYEILWVCWHTSVRIDVRIATLKALASDKHAALSKSVYMGTTHAHTGTHLDQTVLTNCNWPWCWLPASLLGQYTAIMKNWRDGQSWGYRSPGTHIWQWKRHTS